ncbi:MAG: InlB B-repeat-containing protein [Nitrososphaerota archaeon]|jgi:uncharacterized repeat protein (TIGR02543 family)|nr:InlB B-repeat-containing protein [Nitrososphaerota archaeon]
MCNNKTFKFKLNSLRVNPLFASLLGLLLISLSCYCCPLMIVEGFSFEDAVPVSNEFELREAVDNATLGIPVTIALTCDIELNASLTISAGKHIVLISYGQNELFRLIGASDADTIIVESGGVLEIAGITITHPSTANARGVTINTDGALTLSFGEISGNTVSWDGGGVYNAGNFTMSGGMIYGNTARFGGGVLNYGGNFTMSGGAIFDNHASYSGGGLFSYAGDFTMYNGMIIGNSAVGHGGGVFLSASSFSLFDGRISGNTATSGDGGGVYNWQGNFTMLDGIVSHNVAQYGGGVLNDDGNFTMSGGLLSDNRANNSGGGIYNVGNFTIFDGMIFGNVARVGGGVFLDGCSLSLFNGMISNNTADYGGGVVIYGGSFGLFDGVISNNTADYGGGIYIRVGNFDMFNGVISNNGADNGGGIYLASGFVDLFGGIILENIAINDGGGVWVAPEDLDKLCVYDDVVFSNNSASMAYERAPEHDQIYYAQIGTNVTWTASFVQGYNNYDISYVYIPSAPSYYVTVLNSYAETSGTGYYSEADGVTVDAGTRLGYTFIGWTVNEGNIVLSNETSTGFIMPASEVVVTANWEILSEYSIGYVLDGGSDPSNNPLVYTVADLPLSIVKPFKANYTFLGWTVEYDSGTSVTVEGSFTIPVGTIGNLVLSANWAELSLYDITYTLEGGKNAADNPSTYTVDALPISIANPTKEGFVFMGWTIVFFDGNQPDIVVPTINCSLLEGTTGSVGLTAVWEPILDEPFFRDYTRAYETFSSYYDTETGQFCKDLFEGYTIESVSEAEHTMNAAAQVHSYLLVLYGRFDVGQFTAADDTAILEVATRVLAQALADMNTNLKTPQT